MFGSFSNGPTGSQQKTNALLSPSSNYYSLLSSHSRSFLSSPEASPQRYASPILHESSRSETNPSQQVSQSTSSYPKTICRHCKSHNMPECLYTCKISSVRKSWNMFYLALAHSMYDESGAIFCPVLKKCHCTTCIGATNPNSLRDDESDDDDNHIRLPPLFHQWNRVHAPAQRGHADRSNNNNC
jgi:hypothetical protein